MIYCFGNSHAHFFTDSTPSRFGKGELQNEFFQSFSLGPVIAYNFYEHYYPTMIEMLNGLNLTEADRVMIAVGEVDCRWHLPKQADAQKRPVEAIVDECLNRFFRAHRHLRDFGYNVIAWGGHPSTTRGHDDNPSEPVYGDCLTRNKISLRWNDYLESLCKADNIQFVSIVRDLIDVDGLTRMEYYKDYCHLDSKKLLPVVTERFRQLGLL
jgi:hypothetical protein